VCWGRRSSLSDLHFHHLVKDGNKDTLSLLNSRLILRELILGDRVEVFLEFSLVIVENLEFGIFKCLRLR